MVTVADWDQAPMTKRAPPRPLSPIEAIVLLENGGYITPRCHVCAAVYKDAVTVAAKLTADPAWRPASHTPSLYCSDRGRPHCDCAPCHNRLRAGAL